MGEFHDTGASLTGRRFLGVGIGVGGGVVTAGRGVGVVTCSAEDVLAGGLDDGGHGVDGEFEEAWAGDLEEVLG